MNFDQFVNDYKGGSGYGTGSGDDGQCVGLINFGEIQMRGLRYPLQGITYARDFLNANNTRPDIYELVINSTDPNQVPSKGDIIVWSNKGDVRGHVAYVWDAPAGSDHLQVFDQWLGATAEIRTYSYNTCLGWWHIKVNQGSDMITQNDIGSVRVINSEVEGYPFEPTHQGAYDGQEMKAWVGQPWTKLIQQKWSQGEAFRYKRIDAINYYDNTRPQIEKQLADLKVALTNEQNKPAKEVVVEIEKIVEKIVEVEKPVPAKYSWSGILAWITEQLSKLKRSK